MLSGDASFGEGLSTLDVCEILKDVGDDDILADLKTEASLKSGKGKYRNEKSLLGMSSKENHETLINYSQPSYELLGHTDGYSDIKRELVALKHGQAQLLSQVKQFRDEMANERRSREALQKHILNVLPTSPNFNGSNINPISSSISSSDDKTKDLKKKLLMANLKILELQNRSEMAKH